MDNNIYRPVIPGAFVQLRKHAIDDKGTGRLEFMMAHGDGEVDGVKFSIGASVGCNLTVVFKRGNDTVHEHNYTVDARDLIEAAWAIDKELPP